jgi:hypothetical protein
VKRKQTQKPQVSNRRRHSGFAKLLALAAAVFVFVRTVPHHGAEGGAIYAALAFAAVLYGFRALFGGSK